MVRAQKENLLKLFFCPISVINESELAASFNSQTAQRRDDVKINFKNAEKVWSTSSDIAKKKFEQSKIISLIFFMLIFIFIGEFPAQT